MDYCVERRDLTILVLSKVDGFHNVINIHELDKVPSYFLEIRERMHNGSVLAKGRHFVMRGAN